MEEQKQAILSVENLKISIRMEEGVLTPVRGVSFQIREGETMGLVGESGCGKSLTSKAILGINTANCKTEGTITFSIDGHSQDLLKLKHNGAEIRKIRGKDISMIFQEPMTSFSPLFTVGSQIAEAVRIHTGKNKQEARELVIDTMKKVGISNPEKRFDQYPHEFSGGMLQRSLIAMALVCNPRLLIADEPTTALDVTIQAQILELMNQLKKDYGMSILYITHDLGTVAQMCDWVAVMYLGKIVEYASVQEIFKNPLHPYTRGLMGSVHKIGSGGGRLFSIEGTVPVAMNLPDRCGFYDRCSRREGVCGGTDPVMREVLPNHWAACWYAEEKEGCPNV